MSKLLIDTALTNASVVTIGTAVPVGNIQRRIGNCIYASGNTVTINKPGFYKVDIDATFVGTAGNVILSLNNNGNIVPGATVSQTIGTAATELHSAHIGTIVRVFCHNPAILTLVSSGASTPTVNTMNISVVEL